MTYQTLGRSGLQVSPVGLGCEHLEGQDYAAVKAVIDAALEQGVNILDVFMSQPQIRSDIGRALAGRRQQVLLQGHLGAVWHNGQYGRSRELAETLARMEEPLEGIELVGLCTDICVISNALLLKAFLPEVPISVDAACCAGVTPESHRNALNAMKMCQITICNE